MDILIRPHYVSKWGRGILQAAHHSLTFILCCILYLDCLYSRWSTPGCWSGRWRSSHAGLWWRPTPWWGCSKCCNCASFLSFPPDSFSSFQFLLWKFYGFLRAANLSSASPPRSDGGCSRVSSVKSTNVQFGLTWSPQQSGRRQATDPDWPRSRIGCSQDGAWCPGDHAQCGTPSEEQTGYVHCTTDYSTCVLYRTHLKSLNRRGEAEREEEHQGGDASHHL